MNVGQAAMSPALLDRSPKVWVCLGVSYLYALVLVIPEDSVVLQYVFSVSQFLSDHPKPKPSLQTQSWPAALLSLIHTDTQDIFLKLLKVQPYNTTLLNSMSWGLLYLSRQMFV